MMFSLGQCTFGTPAKVQPAAQLSVRHAALFGPISHALSLPAVGDPMSASLIAGLLSLCAPAAIARTIVTVAINAIKGVARAWPTPHVVEERLERLSPSVAHNNPATAVVPEVRPGLAITTIPHLAPRIIFGRAVHAVFRLSLALTATARRSVSTRKRSSRNVGRSPTLTHTFPDDTPVLALIGLADDVKAAKYHAGKITLNHG